MINKINNKNGTVLVLILGVILVVVIFSAIIISLMFSQSRLTKHQFDRDKAIYAAQAGANLALDMMRQGQWNHTNCFSPPCTICSNASCTVNDPDMPYLVNIIIGEENTGVNNTTPINVTVDYSYRP